MNASRLNVTYPGTRDWNLGLSRVGLRVLQKPTCTVDRSTAAYVLTCMVRKLALGCSLPSPSTSCIQFPRERFFSVTWSGWMVGLQLWFTLRFSLYLLMRLAGRLPGNLARVRFLLSTAFRLNFITPNDLIPSISVW